MVRGPNRNTGTSDAVISTPESHHHPKCPILTEPSVKHSPPSKENNAIFNPSPRVIPASSSFFRRVLRMLWPTGVALRTPEYRTPGPDGLRAASHSRETRDTAEDS